MKLRIFITLLGACLLGSHAEAAEKPAGEKGADRLIALLADENFKVREEAALDLWKLGVEALPALKSAANDADPEKSTRARDIVRRIELGITPETEPAVIELTDRFVTATLEEKAVILSQLKKRRAWRQMLKLYAMESSADVRAELEASMDDVALAAAREAIVAGDAKSAREYLELSAVDEAGLLGHADFLRSQGLLDQELKKVAAGEAKSDAWRFALMRAAGNTQAAADIARKLGNLKSAALMSGIEGDPLPWLEQMQKSSDENRLTAAYAEAAARAWKGEISGDAGLEVFTKALDSKSGSERDNALNALHALGRLKLAEPTMVKAHPLIAFQYFDAIERSGDAMRAIGLKEDASDAGPWIEALLAELEGVDVEDQRAPSTAMERLAALAYFNERRGLHARNDTQFLEPIALLSEKNPELFIRLVGNFFGRGEVPYQAPKLAWRMALKWAGQDQQRWQALVSPVLGEDDVITGWWAWLGELDPESDISARFDAMLVIFKIRNDPENIRDKFIERVWK